jgi:hypothetical protein
MHHNFMGNLAHGPKITRTSLQSRLFTEPAELLLPARSLQFVRAVNAIEMKAITRTQIISSAKLQDDAL